MGHWNWLAERGVDARTGDAVAANRIGTGSQEPPCGARPPAGGRLSVSRSRLACCRPRLSRAVAKGKLRLPRQFMPHMPGLLHRPLGQEGISALFDAPLARAENVESSC